MGKKVVSTTYIILSHSIRKVFVGRLRRWATLILFISFVLVSGSQVGLIDAYLASMANPPRRLQLDIIAPNGLLSFGDEVDISLIVTNKSREAVSNVELEIPWNRALLYSGVPNQEGAQVRGATVEIGDLGTEESKTVTIKAQIREVPRRRFVQAQFSAKAQYTPLAKEKVRFQIEPLPETVATVLATGGEIATADGRTTLSFPPAWHHEDAVLAYQTTELIASGDDLEVGSIIAFDVEMEANGAVTNFSQPISITLQLADLLDLSVEGITDRLVLYTRGSEEANVETLPVTFDLEAGTATFATTHFSTFALVEPPDPWSPAYTPPGSSAYTGASTYSYPIQVPPGVGGLTPDLTMSYSSRGYDTNRGPTSSNGFGDGWSFPQAEILYDGAWKTFKYYNESQCCYTGFDPNQMRLNINGATYRLQPIGGITRHGTYIALGNPELKIEYKQDGSTPNIAGEYWVVTTGNGTIYRFGYSPDAEQVAYPAVNTENQNASQLRNNEFIPTSWKLDEIADVYGHKVRYTYDTFGSTRADRQTTVNGVEQRSEIDVAVQEIAYNYEGASPKTKITFSYSPRNSSPAGNKDVMLIGTHQIEKIVVTHGGNVVSAYEFEYDNYNHYYQVGDHTTYNIWNLKEIWQYGNDYVAGTPSSGSHLPVQRFQYQQDTRACHQQSLNDGVNDDPDICTKLLTQVDNGYGGVTTISYQMVDAAVRKSGFMVTSIESWDGVKYQIGTDPSNVTIEYDHSGAITCFDNSSSNCHLLGTQETENIVGFDKAIVTIKGSDAEVLSKAQQTFHNGQAGSDYWLNGRVKEEIQYSASGSTLSKQTTETVQVNGAVQVTRVDYERNDPGGLLSWHIENEYYNGTNEYGGLKQTGEYSSSGQYRCTKYEYDHDTNNGTWIINKILAEKLFAGSCGQLEEGTGFITQTHYRYDDSDSSVFSNDSGLNSKGELTHLLNWYKETNSYVTQRNFYNSDGTLRETQTFDDTTAGSNYAVAVRNWVHYSNYNSLGLPQEIAKRGYNGVTPEIQTVTYDPTFPWRVQSITDANGITTQYTYDTFGRLKTITQPGGFTTTTTYTDKLTGSALDAPTPLEIQTSYSGNVVHNTSQFYDGLGRVVKATKANYEVDGQGQQTLYMAYDYDGLGRQTCVTGWLAGDTAQCLNRSDKTITAYDALGRPKSVQTPDGTQTIAYSISGQYLKTEAVDTEGNRVSHMYDVFGRLRFVEEHIDNQNGIILASTEYVYDVRDQLEQVILADGSVTQMNYDSLGRKIKMVDPDMGTWHYDYDIAGNLIAQTDAKGQTICFYYDNFNRLVTKVEDETPSVAPTFSCPETTPASGLYHLVSYEYGSSVPEIGKVKHIGWGDVPTMNSDTFTYDSSKGRLETQTRTVAGQPFVMTTNAWDLLDRPTQITYPNGDSVGMSYDEEGSQTLTLNGLTLVSNGTYNGQEQIARVVRGNGTQTVYGYHGVEQNFRLETIEHQSATGDLPTFTYDLYDKIGNIKTVTTLVNGVSDTQEFTYDSLSRLETATGSVDNYSLKYEYSATGNIINIEEGSGASLVNKSFNYTGDNKPHAVNSVGSDSFSYDANGNMEFRVDASGSYSQTFDVENRLVSVVNQNTGAETEFYYDADGIRILTIQCTGACDTNYSNEVSRTYTPFPDYEEQVNREAIQIVGPTPTPSAPVAPTNLDAVEISSGVQTAVYLTWAYSGDSNSVTYNVYRSSYNFASDNGELIAIGLTVPIYSDISGDLSIHRYRVTAVSTIGESEPSNIAPAGCTGTCSPQTNYLFGKIRSNARRLSAPVQQTASTLNPVQDSHISSSSPTSTSGGTASTIRNRAGSPEYRVYLQFDLSSLSGSVQQATLRLYVTDGSNDGGSVYAVSNNYNSGSGPWTEAGLTYNNAPALGATPLDSLGAVSNGTWVELDVTSGVTTGGLVSFGMGNTSTDSAYFSSKEGSNPPELVVTTGSGGNQSPTATDDTTTATSEQATVMTVLANDSDPDGDTLTITAVSNPAHGSTSHNGTTVTYTSATGYTGADSFSYTISDGNGGSATATVNVTVQSGGGNQTPTATDDTVTATSEQATVLTVLANDSDPDGDTLTITAVSNPAHGTATHNGTTVTYTSATGYTGADSFTYTISDGNGGTATATVNVTVQSGGGTTTTTLNTIGDTHIKSSSPTTSYGTESTFRNRAGSPEYRGHLQFDLSSLSGSVQQATLRLYVTSGSNEGGDVYLVSNNYADGSGPWTEGGLTYNNAPALGSNLLGSLGVVSSGTWVELDVTSGVTTGGLVSFGMNPLTSSSVYFSSKEGSNPPQLVVTTGSGGGGNQSPTAADDTTTATSEQATVMTVLANDSDPDGDTLTITAVSTPAHGTATHNGTTVTYTSATGYTGADSFTYTISDGNGGTDTATVNVTVQSGGGGNQSPTATDDTTTATSEQATVMTVLANDSDPDGDPLTITAVSNPAHGTATHNGTTVTYTSATGYTGADSFTYTISDGNGGTDTATINVTVQSGGGTTTATFNSIGDTHIKSSSPDTSYYSELTFRNRAGSPEYRGHLQFDLSSLSGSVQQATLRLYVTSGSNEGGEVYLVSNNYADGSGPWTEGGLTYNNAPALGSNLLGSLGVVSSGTWVELDVTNGVTTGGLVSFGMNPLTSSSVYFSSKEGSNPPELVVTTAAAATIVAQDESTATTAGNSVQLSVLDNDTYPVGAPVTITITTPAIYGSVVVNSDHTITYTPVGNCLNGDDTFVYTLSDGAGNSDTATVTVTVTDSSAQAATTPVPTPDWQVEGSKGCDRLGYTISSAGDVNGDGFDDVIVGAGRTSSTYSFGSAKLYLGSATGLGTTPVWEVVDEQHLTWNGFFVAGAGDVNGDGFDDVIVSAPLYQVNGIQKGRVSVYYGSATGLATTADWTKDGEQFASRFGHDVAAAGDVDGDGYDDILVSDLVYDVGATEDVGKVYVFYGAATGLAARENAPWTAVGEAGGDWFGYSIRGAGYLNELATDANRYSDIVISAVYAAGSKGKAYVYYGSANGPGSAADWSYVSDQAGSELGAGRPAVDGAGDVNGDGYDDLVVGAQNYQQLFTREGRVDLFYGGSNGLATTPAWTTYGEQEGAAFGWSVAGAGDVNQDGYADLLVGADEYDVVNNKEGRAYLFLGSSQGPAATATWVAYDTQTEAHFAHTVGSAGDLDGDGWLDIVIGQQTYDEGALLDRGRAVAYYAVGSGLAVTLMAQDDSVTTTDDVAATVPVLANDVYVGNPTVAIETAPSSGTAVVNGDNTITYTPVLGATGVVSLTYRLSEGASSDTAVLSITIEAGNTLVVTTAADSGTGSLREAMATANSQPGLQTITFAIPTSDGGYDAATGAFKILLLSALPTVTDPIVIDASTQPGASCNPLQPLVEIEDGTSLDNGLYITAGGSTVKGLVINGFTNGIFLESVGNNVVQCNILGLDVSGTQIKGNVMGVAIKTDGNLIGGTTPETRNILSGNAEGIEIRNGSYNVIQGNYIGTDITGMIDLGNSQEGVELASGGSHNIIGGSTGTTPDGACTGACNVLSGNGTHGIGLFHEHTDTVIQGNFIGLDVTGQNGLGNTQIGIYIYWADNNLIGGDSPNERNVISGHTTYNFSSGVRIASENFQDGGDEIVWDIIGNVVRGNYIGTNSDGTLPIPNYTGVDLRGIAPSVLGVTQNIIEGNLIAYSQQDGIQFRGDFPARASVNEGNIITRNSIHSNTGLGIDLHFSIVEPNDVGDVDNGPNALQNYPVLTYAVPGASETTVAGVLQTAANGSYTVELFNNSSCNSSGYGEGETFLQAVAVTTDAEGNGTFTTTVAQALALGQFVTATATDASGNTSEFSACVVVSETVAVNAIDDTATTDNDVAVTVPVLANDSYGSSPTVAIETAPSSGTAVVNGDNTVTYTPQLGSGGVVTFTYSLSEGGASDTALVTVTVVPPAAADFVGNPTAGAAPLTVVFSDDSTGSPTAWFWQFGDGAVSTEQNPTHVYTEPGSYTVTLTVNNDGGTMSVTKVDYITVTLGAPVANFSTTPISGTVPLTVTLTDLSTGQPTSWAWEFGDGATATAQHPNHTYSAAGTYTVTLTVSNTVGSDTATGTVTVLNSVADAAKVVRRISYRFGGQVVATRVVAEDENGQLIDNEAFTGLFYVHGDHLGSATALSYGQDRPTLQGTLVPDSVARFLPFGGYRGAKPQTNPAVSDRGFTGHKHNDDLGLVYMNARYYVPGIGRFASADTIVPDPMNPQAFNRYSYALNNPVKYTDPSGHCVFAPPFDTAMCIALLALALRGDSDQSLPPNNNFPQNETVFIEGGCNKTLPDCFGDIVYLKDFPAEQISESEVMPYQVPLDEFGQLLDGIAEDLYFHDITWPGGVSGRGTYDTPFYNGGGKGVTPRYPADQQVCIGDMHCSGRSEINYIAQGMWDARAEKSIIVSDAIVYYWKGEQYGELPSQDTLFWNRYGYYYYQRWKESAEQAFEEWDGL